MNVLFLQDFIVIHVFHTPHIICVSFKAYIIIKILERM